APSETAVADVVELYEGLGEAGVPVIGGDTTSADGLLLSVTAIGRSERVPGRAGARPGDVLVVTGPLGAGGAAFRAERYARPPLRLREGRELAATAHAMLDLSDGLAADAGHIAGRSGCRLRTAPSSTTSASARITSCLPRYRKPSPASRRSAAARKARASSCSLAAAGSTSAASSI